MSKEKNLPPARCAFCGQVPEKGEVLVQGPTYEFFCTKCARSIMESYGSMVQKKQKENDCKHDADAQQRANPSLIKDYLDEYIIEQDQAKKVLATAVYNHMLRIKMKKEQMEGADDIEKSNIIMIGPSGVGKTALIRRLAKAMNVPFVIEDITSFSSTGFVGRDVEAILRDLVDAANGNIKAAECGIVYIDEIDKCSRKGDSPSISSDPAHESLQQALLKLIEGSEVEVSEKKGQRHHPNAPTFKFNTENVLFIVGGAFEGIDKIVARRMKKHTSSVGFGSKVVLDEDKAMNDYLSDIRTEDLKKFGILPELLGRLPVICTLRALTKESLVKILTEPNNALVKQYQSLFQANGIALSFTDAALEAIADRAIKRGTGARSLRGIMEDVLGDVMYEAPSEENLAEVIIDAEGDDFKVNKEYQEKKEEEVY